MLNIFRRESGPHGPPSADTALVEYIMKFKAPIYNKYQYLVYFRVWYKTTK